MLSINVVQYICFSGIMFNQRFVCTIRWFFLVDLASFQTNCSKLCICLIGIFFGRETFWFVTVFVRFEFSVFLLEFSQIAKRFVFVISRILYCPKPFVFCPTIALFYHTFSVHLLFIILVELSHSSSLTFTQGPRNVSPSFWSERSPLCCFLLSQWWPILVTMFCGLQHILIFC